MILLDEPATPVDMAGPTVVLDTDVASLLINQNAKTLSDQLADDRLALSLVTLGELMTWSTVGRWGPRRWHEFLVWLGDVPVLDMSVDVAFAWGRLMAASDKRGRRRPANDTWIAATCMVENLPLATLNAKDFADYVEHHDLRMALD